MTETSLGHIPAKPQWEFDETVTDCFDDMLKRSIPQLDVMRQAVFELGSKYVKQGTTIIDLGCSRGDTLQPFLDRFGAGVHLVGVEISKPMLRIARERFGVYDGTIGGYGRKIVEIREMDLRKEYPKERASLTLAVLTLQFTPIEHRQRILRNAFQATIPGGAIIVVEKVLGASSELDEQFVTMHHAMKRGSGYSDEEIRRKAMSLEGVLVPVTASWNEEMLGRVGFGEVDCFWRWMNFAAWVGVRGA